MLLCEIRDTAKRFTRKSIHDLLREYASEPNVYISFTEINKLGINPRSGYETPIGIYAYNVKRIWERHQSEIERGELIEKIIPFASKQPYIQVFRRGEGKMLDLCGYDLTKLQEDLQIIKKRYPKLPNSVYEKIIKKYGNSNIIGDAIWDLTYMIAEYLGGDLISRWNGVLRALGYAVVDDCGMGIVYHDEPMQTIFLSKAATHMIETVMNYEGTAAKELNKPREFSNLAQLRAIGLKKEDIQMTDGRMDVYADVRMNDKKYKRLPFKFGVINGNFICHNCGLVSLEGAPRRVLGDFRGYDNPDLKDVSGARGMIVGGDLDLGGCGITASEQEIRNMITVKGKVFLK